MEINLYKWKTVMIAGTRLVYLSHFTDKIVQSTEHLSKKKMEQYKIVNNEKEQRFEIDFKGEKALLEYRHYKNDIALMHTFVPEVLNGKGLASALAHYALEWVKDNNKKAKVYCPFVAAYLKRHPEYNDIII